MADPSLWSEDDPRTRLAELTADTSDPAKELPLRRDVRSLGILLGRVLVEQEGEAFFEAHGWKSVESHSMIQTAGRLNRLSPELKAFADMPEPPGPVRDFPWSGACLFKNKHATLPS